MLERRHGGGCDKEKDCDFKGCARDGGEDYIHAVAEEDD